MVIRYEYRHKNPASDAFKKLSLASILEERMVVINKKKQYELLCPWITILNLMRRMRMYFNK